MSTTGSVFRNATAADAPVLVDLIRSAYRGAASQHGWTSEADFVGGDRIDQSGVRELIDAPGSMMLILTDGMSVVACCQLEDRGHGIVYFGTFAVDPGVQARGVGRRVLAEAERTATTRYGATRLKISVLDRQAQLISYYERQGFHRTGETGAFPSDPIFARPLVEDLYFVYLEKDVTTVTDADAHD